MHAMRETPGEDRRPTAFDGVVLEAGQIQRIAIRQTEDPEVALIERRLAAAAVTQLIWGRAPSRLQRGERRAVREKILIRKNRS